MTLDAFRQTLTDAGLAPEGACSPHNGVHSAIVRGGLVLRWYNPTVWSVVHPWSALPVEGAERFVAYDAASPADAVDGMLQEM